MSWRTFKKLLLFTLIASSSLATMGCGKPVRSTGEFEPYVVQFEDFSKKAFGYKLNVTDIKIQFSPLDHTKLGTCSFPSGSPQIDINETQWKELSPDVREILMFHELGHCILSRKHNNSEVVKGRRWESLMAQWPQKISDYKDHREEYLLELFIPAS